MAATTIAIIATATIPDKSCCGGSSLRSRCDIVHRMITSPALDASLSLRYPIGKFDPAQMGRAENIAVIAALPATLAAAVAGLVDAQLDTEYRPGGWTARQVVHHVADSHVNAYTRVRLALTEDWPAIKPYREGRWAELSDARGLPVGVSLALLEALHRRWVSLLGSLGEAEWARGYEHPENGRQDLETVTALYSWHSRHHAAHIAELRKRMRW